MAFSPAVAGRAFARRRAVGAQAVQSAAARRRVRGYFVHSRLHPLVISQVLGEELPGKRERILDQAFRRAGDYHVTT